MGKIQITEDKKTGQIKYWFILPKDTMQELVVYKGDKLNIKSVVGNEITFKLIRGSEK